MDDTMNTPDLDHGTLAARDTAAATRGSGAGPTPDRKKTFLCWLRQAAPNALVLVALGGLAFYGHVTGWQIPRFSALTGSGSQTQDDWCTAHAVPESVCVECNPNLLPRPAAYGWCAEHGVHDCPLEHPDVTQVKTPPQVTAGDLARARRALDLVPRPENSSRCKMHGRRIQFASEDAFQRAGIDVEPVSRGPVAEFITANGELDYDQTRLARLSARLPGAVWRVDKKLGDPVRAGEVLALVEATEIGRAKAEFLQAAVQYRLRDKNLRAHQELWRSAATSERALREAEAALREGRIRLLAAQQALVNLGLPVDVEGATSLPEEQLAVYLQFLGLPDSLRRSLDPRTTTANLLPVVSPLDGVVIARDVVAGEVVDTSKALFVVGDVRRLWLTLNVRQEDARNLAPGLPVRFRPDGSSEEVEGAIRWLSTAVDPKTRTLKVRAEIVNAHGRLRANCFGSGRIILREEKDAIVVPSEAVHWEGDCHVVFVRDKNFLAENGLKVFHTRSVRLGAKDERNTEIIAGLLPGEVVASKGSGTLRAELLKNNLGEG